MKASILLPAVSILIALTGCAHTSQYESEGAELVANDPSNGCMQALQSEAFVVAKLAPKGVGYAGEPTMEMLAEKSFASADERAALSQYSSKRQACLASGAAYRRSDLPALLMYAVEDSARDGTANLARLYSGEITFGEFNKQRGQILAAMEAKLRGYEEYQANLDDVAAERKSAARAQARAQLGAALQNFSAQMQAQQALQQQQIRQNRWIFTDCQRTGNSTSCITH